MVKFIPTRKKWDAPSLRESLLASISDWLPIKLVVAYGQMTCRAILHAQASVELHLYPQLSAKPTRAANPYSVRQPQMENPG